MKKVIFWYIAPQNVSIKCNNLFFFWTEAETSECWLSVPYLPGALLRMVTGEDAHGNHGCQMLFPRCRRMIGFMDPHSALRQRSGRPCLTWEKKHTGRMWNVSEQGHFKGHCEACHPVSLAIGGFTARPHATHRAYRVWIHPLFEVEVWLGLCLPSAWGGGGESAGNNAKKICKDTFHAPVVSVQTVKSAVIELQLQATGCTGAFSLLIYLICKVLQTSTRIFKSDSCLAEAVEKRMQPVSLMSVSLVRLVYCEWQGRGCEPQQLQPPTLPQFSVLQRWAPWQSNSQGPRDNFNDWSLSSWRRWEGAEQPAER